MNELEELKQDMLLFDLDSECRHKFEETETGFICKKCQGWIKKII